jgi:hypothetical protein
MPFTQHDVTSLMPLMSELVLRVRQEVDVVGSSHVTDTEILGWLNQGLSEAYTLCTEAYEDLYLNTEIFSLNGLSAPSCQNYVQFPNDLTNPIWTSVGVSTTFANQIFLPGPPAVVISTLHYMQQVCTQLQIDERIQLQASFQQVVPGGFNWARLAWGNDAYVDVYFEPRADDTSPQVAHLGDWIGGIATLKPVLVNGMDIGRYQVTMTLDGEQESTTGTLRIYARNGTTSADSGALNYLSVFSTIYVFDVGVLQPINSWFVEVPDDFFKILRVDRSVSGTTSDGQWTSLDRINQRDEAAWNQAWAITIAMPRPIGYLLQDNILKVVPPTNCQGTYRMMYYPAWPDLPLTARVDLGPPGQHWEEMGVLYACAKVAIKEEGDPTPFQNQKNEWQAKVRSDAKDRDAGRAAPPPMTGTPWWDKVGRGNYGPYGGSGLW